MDLDPFLPLGIEAPTMRFLDLFLLHCLLCESPPDTPEEIAALARNQQRTAAQGREPGLRLERAGQSLTLVQWGQQLLEAFAPLAERLDRPLSGTAQAGAHVQALALARAGLADPSRLPSARVLQTIEVAHGGCFIDFGRERSLRVAQAVQAEPLPPAERERLRAVAEASVLEQQRIESLDRLPFEAYRQQYLAPERLGLPQPECDVQAA